MAEDTVTRRQIAVIGSGVAGLTSAWALRTHAQVTLFEADDRLGGHAHTHELDDPSGRVVGVDSGFIVHNRRTYPVLLRLFEELGVETQPSEMSMSVTCEGCGLEYAGARKARGLFPSWRTLTRPRYLLMLAEVVRFHRRAATLLATEDDDLTLAQFAAEARFSRYFVQHFLSPMVACVWSCPAGTAMQYPARYLFTFLAHHGMLGIGGSPQWRTVTGGSRSYVERIAKEIPQVLVSTPVRSVHRGPDGVRLVDAHGDERHYAAVVIATHPAQALELLADPSADERDVLGAIRYSHNEVVLHTDPSILPRSPGAQASWNYRMPTCDGGSDPVVVTYDMNRLQRLPTAQRYLVTLGAAQHITPGRTIATMAYEHPIYTPRSLAAQARLRDLDDDQVVFAGAYHGWGFHEDGARSGRDAARRLGSTW